MPPDRAPRRASFQRFLSQDGVYLKVGRASAGQPPWLVCRLPPQPRTEEEPRPAHVPCGERTPCAQGFHQGFVLALQHTAEEPEHVRRSLRDLLQGVEDEQAQQATSLRVRCRAL